MPDKEGLSVEESDSPAPREQIREPDDSSKATVSIGDWVLGLCNRWLDPLAKLGLAGAAILACMQYWQANNLEKLSRTFSYIEDFERGETASARRKLNAALRPYLADFITINEQNDGVTESDRRDMLLLIVEEAPEDSVAEAIDTVVDFYEGLSLCVDERLCDRSAATEYFCQVRALEFWDNYKAYIDYRRANNSDYAISLQNCASSVR